MSLVDWALSLMRDYALDLILGPELDALEHGVHELESKMLALDAHVNELQRQANGACRVFVVFDGQQPQTVYQRPSN